jgi:hypothetical protein
MSAQPGQDVPDEMVKPLAEMLLDDYDQEFNAQHLRWQDFAGQARKILAVVLPLLPDFDWIPPDEFEENPEEDSCRLVEVDGEPVRIRGGSDMDEEGRTHLGTLFRAARAAMKAEKEAEEAAIRKDERAKVAEGLSKAAAGYRRSAKRGGVLQYEMERRATILEFHAERITRGTS